MSTKIKERTLETDRRILAMARIHENAMKKNVSVSQNYKTEFEKIMSKHLMDSFTHMFNEISEGTRYVGYQTYIEENRGKFTKALIETPSKLIDPVVW